MGVLEIQDKMSYLIITAEEGVKPEDTQQEFEKVGGISLVVMIMKSFLGIGIYSLPSMIPKIGLLGFLAVYLITASITLVYSVLLVRVANHLKYYGSRYK